MVQVAEPSGRSLHSLAIRVSQDERDAFTLASVAGTVSSATPQTDGVKRWVAALAW
jgi:hypothetical protein